MAKDKYRDINYKRLVFLVLVLLTMLGLLTFYLVTRPSPLCKRPSEGTPQSGISSRVLIDSDGEERCYLIYRPISHSPEEPVMVILTIHGYLSNPQGIMLIDGWRKIAEREGFILVYPQGTGYPLGWNASATFRSEKDDIQFFRDVLADLGTLLKVDENRVYINGVSNGGMMSLNAACEAPDVFAAVGSVGTSIEFEQMVCQPKKPVPLILFHGTGDPGMPYEGGDMKLLGIILGVWPPPFMYPVEMFAANSAEKIGCPSEPETEGPLGDITTFTYAPCERNAEVILYKLRNHGHTWPGGPPLPLAGGSTQDIHASEEMFNFFVRHPQRSP